MKNLLIVFGLLGFVLGCGSSPPPSRKPPQVIPSATNLQNTTPSITPAPTYVANRTPVPLVSDRKEDNKKDIATPLIKQSFQDSPAPARKSGSPSGRGNKRGLPRQTGYIRGPRGGCYYINGNGNKTYVDRSLCN